MDWNDNLTILNYRLPRLYRSENAAIRIADMAHFNSSLFNTSGPPIDMWFNILDYARKVPNWKLVIALLEVVTSSNELGAEDNVLNSILENFKKNQFSVTSPKLILGITPPPEEEKRLEKLMGNKSTLLPINFLERGIDCARAVVRILTPKGIGTGFLIDRNFIVTNNHVIKNKEEAFKSQIEFNYQETVENLPAPINELSLNPDAGFWTSTDDPETKDLDFTVVKVKGNPNVKYGALSFSIKPINKEDFVNIIQHPAGGFKQIALYHNVVTSVGDRVIQYLTDTLPGSSGSPVFDSSWKVVALHHAGGKLIDPESNQYVFRNEGINGLRIKEIIDTL